MLPKAQRELWDAYQQVEARALRVEKVRTLGAFLDCLMELPDQEWFPWARSLAERVVDRSEMLIIRMPLFEQAVFPALFAGYRAGLPGCARWLAGLSSLLYRCRRCQEQLPEVERDAVGLLRAALRHDPTDRRSRQRLLEKLLDRLRFSLHELPAGVLYGMDGASPEQCRELEKEAEEVRTLAAVDGQEERYSELIDWCRFHFQVYREYLLNPADCRSYAQYLSQEKKQMRDQTKQR
jgi:hypothetical protein